MSRRSHAATARKLDPTPATPAPQAPGPNEAAAPWDSVEETFFRRGDAGHFEPPVILPVDSILFPLMGVAFLAVLTAFVLH